MAVSAQPVGETMPSASSQPSKTVALGPGLRTYAFHEERAATSQWFDFAWNAAQEHSDGLCWPEVTDDISGFAEKIKAFAIAVRSLDIVDGNVRVGLPGGRTSKHQYHVTHFCRLVLLHVESEMMPDAFQNVKYEVMAKWLPDQLGHCGPLMKWTGSEIQKRFDMSPLMVSCWACLVATIGGSKHKQDMDHAAALSEVLCSSDEIWWAGLHNYERDVAALCGSSEADIFAPGPAWLWKQRGGRACHIKRPASADAIRGED